MTAPGLVNKTATWSYDVTTSLYRNNQDGSLLTYDELRRALIGVVSGAKTEGRALAQEVADGSDTPDHFTDKMLALIVGLHMAAAIAAGDLPALRKELNARLRAVRSREAAYLAGLAATMRDTLRGLEDAREPYRADTLHTASAVWAHRAASYMDAAIPTFEYERWRTMQLLDYTEAARILHPEAEHCNGCVLQADRGYVPIEQLVPLGGEECGQWCMCTVDYRKTTIRLEDAV